MQTHGINLSAHPAKPSARPWLQLCVAVAVLSIACVLLFVQLGHYALWDDEAITALTAKAVWETGDTSAMLGHNILAYRNGLLLRDLKDRATPPLQFYLAAPFVGLLGETSLAARLPFALCGLGCVALVLWWMHRDGASNVAWIVVGIAIVANASLFLFARQARYYGLAMLLATAVGYTYLHLRTRRGLVAHVILSILLLAANYMIWAAVVAMLVVDYAIWGRHRRALRGWDWAILLAPQVIAGAILVSIWNPLRIAEPRAEDFSWLKWHATLLWWNARDLVRCEFGVGALLIIAPVVALVARSMWLARAVLALAVGVLVISTASPQNPSNIRVADVRYLSFLIPLCLATGVLALLPLTRVPRVGNALVVVVALVAFATNLLHFNWLESDVPPRSTVALYVKELLAPVPEPYTPVAEWIRANVKEGESVLVVPPHMMYPLMFHAPNAVYAWQLSAPAPAELAHLPPVHVALREVPDFIVAFGPARAVLNNLQMETSEPLDYELAQRIDVFWRDRYRPELFWRTFEPRKEFDPLREGILILRRVRPRPSFRL